MGKRPDRAGASCHDRLFRFAFARARHAVSLLRHLLPPGIARRIDWGAVRAVPATKDGPGLRIHHGDLLFQAELREGQDLVFFLIEHKAGRARGLLGQLLRYVVHIRFEVGRRSHAVPYVVSIVVHHGRHRLRSLGWRASAPRAATEPALSWFDPRMPFVLVELAGTDDRDLRGRPLTALGTLTLLCLQFLPGRSDAAVIRALRRWQDLIRSVDASTEGGMAMQQLSSYVLHLNDLSPARLSTAIARIVQRPTEGTVMSTADKLRAEGRAEGRAVGHAEGRAQGQQEILLRQLRARFGLLPRSVDRRVRAASAKELDRWLLLVLEAESLGAVFGDG